MTAFPSSDTIATGNLDSASDSPASARADILAAFQTLQNIIDSYGDASGIAPLNSSSVLANTYLPNTLISSSGNDLTVQPDTNRFSVEDAVNLTPLTLAQLGTAISTPQEGDIAYCTNGDAGSKCLVVYDGTNWKVVSLGATAATS